MSLLNADASPTVTPTAFNLDRNKALSLLAYSKTRIATPNGVVGIRGTGVYLETKRDLSYACKCYRVTDLTNADDFGTSETIELEHNEESRYILADPNAQSRIQPTSILNHDGRELLLIETLVGRRALYSAPKSKTRTRVQYS